MFAKDVMTKDVVTIGPDATIVEAAKLMCQRGISGVPVVRDGAVVGMLSEGDLMRRSEIGTDRNRGSWWLRILSDDEESALAFVKSHARRVEEVMSSDPVTVTEDTPLAEIAEIIETRHIKRVPVVRDGKLTGLVSRANIIQALAGAGVRESAAALSDDHIRAALLAELGRQPWWHGWTSNITVAEGVVHFWGLYVSESEHRAARVAAETIPGVKQVEDHRLKRTVNMDIC